jgi:hypothetical protein
MGGRTILFQQNRIAGIAASALAAYIIQAATWKLARVAVIKEAIATAPTRDAKPAMPRWSMQALTISARITNVLNAAQSNECEAGLQPESSEAGPLLNSFVRRMRRG